MSTTLLNLQIKDNLETGMAPQQKVKQLSKDFFIVGEERICDHNA